MSQTGLDGGGRDEKFSLGGRPPGCANSSKNIELRSRTNDPRWIQHDKGASITHRIHWTRAWGAAACGLACLLTGPAWTQQPRTNTAAAIASQSTEAQTAAAGTGTISGSVVDSNGTIYGGAHATLTAAGAAVSGQNPKRTQDTDGDGRFRFTALAAGTYTLTISSSGFGTQTRTIALAEGKSYQAEPIMLQVSSTSSVHVTASETPMEIARAEVQLEEKQRVLGFIPNFWVRGRSPRSAADYAKLKFAAVMEGGDRPGQLPGRGHAGRG